MNVSVIIPAQASDAPHLAGTLRGIGDQRYDAGRVEVFVVQYGASAAGAEAPPIVPPGLHVHFLSVDNPSPYAARNLASRAASGEVLLFTEPGCVPDPAWIAAHVAALRDSPATLVVGHVAPARETWAVATFLSYEGVRDAWVFSGASWQHLFGRPKNMAILRRRFDSHGPFAEVIRGADSKLVQHVARELSCDEIGHAPGAVVRQEVVRGLPSCLRDRFVHARALRVHKSSHAAPIALPERVRLFRETVATRRYGFAQAGMLLAFLGAGIAAFRLGGASARFVRLPVIHHGDHTGQDSPGRLRTPDRQRQQQDRRKQD